MSAREGNGHGAVRYLPTALTLMRLAASPLAASLLVHREFRAALATVLLAGVTDWLDGWSARALRVSGNFGIVLDPLADKVLLVTLFIALTHLGLVPLAMLFLALGRDLVIVIGAALLTLLRNYRRFTPSVLGKVSTFFQIAFILAVLFNAAWPDLILFSLAQVGLFLTATFTFLSGADYVRRGIVMARVYAE